MRWGMPPRGGGGGGYNVLGIFILKPIAWLIAAIVFMSAFGSLLQRSGIPLLEYSVLTVGGVFRGEIWRLATWAPIELSPLGLLFGCLLLYFIGPDMLRRWGTRRFFANYLGGAVIVGVLTCLVGGFLWSDVARFPYTGLWPMEEAMLIAWAALFRDRQILMFLVLPIAGRNLIALVIGITVVMAALGGFAQFVPHFLAELLALAYMDVVPARTWLQRARLARYQREYRRRTAKLTRVDRDEPPRWTH